MNIQIPFNYLAREYQRKFLAAPQRFKILVLHRRAGKTKTLLNQQIMRTQQKHSFQHGWLAPEDPLLTPHERNRINTYYYFLPTYRQAKSIIFDELIKLHVPMELVDKINESELAVYWKNGSIQRFVGTEDYNKHRGSNPIDVVFDEFAEQDERVWTEIAQPILRENHGTASWGFTPKGKNHAYHLLQKAKLDPENWYTAVMGVKDTGGLTNKEVSEAKRDTPEALFEQEYNCSFVENAGAFFRRIRENCYYNTIPVNPAHYYQIGIDLAKHNDYTVLTPFDLNTFTVLQLDRFNQIDWNLQKARIEAAALRHNDAKLKIDRTGVGDPIVEDLVARGLNIDEEEDSVVFTEKSKKMMLANLSILLEQDRIKIPYDEGLIAELESMQNVLKVKGDKRKIVTEVPSSMTDDRIMSLALAVKDVKQPLKDLRILTTSNATFDDLNAAI